MLCNRRRHQCRTKQLKHKSHFVQLLNLLVVAMAISNDNNVVSLGPIPNVNHLRKVPQKPAAGCWMELAHICITYSIGLCVSEGGGGSGDSLTKTNWVLGMELANVQDVLNHNFERNFRILSFSPYLDGCSHAWKFRVGRRICLFGKVRDSAKCICRNRELSILYEKSQKRVCKSTFYATAIIWLHIKYGFSSA